MLSNYHYFLALAEEKNISRAAEKLYISHQCLSKYLKNLEEAYHVTLFERSPKLTLTHAGQIYLDTIRQVQLLEANLESQMADIRQSKRGLIRFGTTEGRYRILVPDLLSQFHDRYPDVTLDVQYSSSSRTLNELVSENKLDLVLLNQSDLLHPQLDSQFVLEEQFYLVISEEMLKNYFPKKYPTCKAEFAQGVDLSQFQHVPFVLSKRGYHSRQVLDKYLQSRSLALHCVMEITQLDLHYMMTARNYAASFCWSMYLPTIQQMNALGQGSRLNVFPLKGEKIHNQLVLVNRKGKIFPEYGRELIRLIQAECSAFADPSFEQV